MGHMATGSPAVLETKRPRESGDDPGGRAWGHAGSPPGRGRAGASVVGGPASAARRTRTAVAPLPRNCHELMADAGRVLGRAIGASGSRERFAEAHLAALRGAAAVLAARARPRRAAHASVWELVPRVAPDLGEWAAFFAGASRTRQAIAAGIAAPVSAREADDMVRAAATFLDLVDAALSDGGAPGRSR